MVNWDHNPRLPRVQKTDTFIVFYLFVLYCIVSCHVSKSLSLYCLCYVTKNIFFCFYFNIACGVVTGLLIIVDIDHFHYIFIHVHVAAHTHTSTHVWLAHSLAGGIARTRHRSLIGIGRSRSFVRDNGQAHTHARTHTRTHTQTHRKKKQRGNSNSTPRTQIWKDSSK